MNGPPQETHSGKLAATTRPGNSKILRMRSALGGLLLFCSFLIPSWAEAERGFLEEIEAALMENVAGNPQEAESSEAMWYRRGSIISGSNQGKIPAIARITLPADGEYFIWAYYHVSTVRRKSFAVIVEGHELVYGAEAYGKEERADIYQGRKMNEKGMIWTREQATLKAGPLELQLSANPTPPEGKWKDGAHPPTLQILLVTNDPNYEPENR